jgi:hypothetical protein
LVMVRMSRAHVALVVLIPIVTLGACSESESAKVIDTADVAVLVAAPARGGDDAAIGGEVTVVDGCLGIDDAVAVWPFGTEVTDRNGPLIDVPGLGKVRVGDHVTGAGGYLSATSEGREGLAPTVPDTCKDRSLVAFRPE